MVWIILVVAVAAALAMFEFWPRKPGLADNGIDRVTHFKSPTRVNRLDRAGR
jgi:hypothetical protein